MLPLEGNRISPPNDAEQAKEGTSKLRGGQSRGREAKPEPLSRLCDSIREQKNPEKLNRGFPGRHSFPNGGVSDPPLELIKIPPGHAAVVHCEGGASVSSAYRWKSLDLQSTLSAENPP